MHLSFLNEVTKANIILNVGTITAVSGEVLKFTKGTIFVSEKVEGLDTFIVCDIACGESHSMALSEWGEVFSWGSNLDGQLGNY